MTDDAKQPNQAMPTGGSARDDRAANASGRTGGGESGGGAFKQPEQVKPNPDNPPGQDQPDYSGPGDKSDGSTNPNAVAGS